MAYLDDLLRELEERGATGKIYNAGSSSTSQSSSTQKKKKEYTEELLAILHEDAKKKGVKLELSDYGIISGDTFKAQIDDIAPVKKNEEADNGLLDFFQKGALGDINLRKHFSDGYQFGDILKTGGHVASQVGKAILGTAGDVGLGVAKGFASAAEGVADLASYGIAAGLDVAGRDAAAKQWRKTASENTVEEWTKGADEYLNRYSVAGRTTDSISQGIGQIGSIIATGGLGKAAGLGAKAVTALTIGATGVSGVGSGMGEAYRSGATDEEAATYGLIAGASDALTELLFGGLGKAVGAVGLSTGLSSADDLLAKKVSGLFTNQIAKNFAEYGIKAGAEGFEEVLAGTAQAIGKKITYMKEEELSEILKDENLLEQFVVGAAASGLMQSGMIPGTREGSLREANAQGRDFITGLNQNEQTVIDKEVEKRVAAQEEKSGKKLTKKELGKIEQQVLEDLDRGGIDIDTIEEVMGGETYTNYKKLVDAEEKMQREYDELGKKEKYTLADDARYKELGERLKYVREKGAKNELRKRLDEQVSGMVKDSRLTESFNERARRGQSFEADLEQYDEKRRAIVQKAVESGILNNTRRTHDFVDMVAKIAADKGVSFDFANNAKLKETGFAVEGKTVNGFLTKDGITVNIQSAKALNSVVGHEITHVLEGTELYTELQKAVLQYAETKKDVADRRAVLEKLYANVEGADIDAELTADLVGDYLFTDSDFINNLSANHRNVFQKIYDEIKYLLKVATAGSKEARELEKVKRAFEKAYREGGKAQADTKYSLAPVAAVQPKSGAWHAGASTEEVRAAHPTLYAVDETATEERNPTQVKGTVSSYRKVYSALQAEGFDGTILDASSGLGYGTKAGIEEFGFNVEDIEPYPDKSYHPKHTDYSALDKKYDVIISNAVLNVLPQDQRDALVVKMGELLNEGGRMFINVRGKDVLNASGKIAIDEAGMEYFIPRTAKTGSYQKGFTKPELIAYLEDALGDGFTVTPGSKVFGGSTPTAIVTKKGGHENHMRLEEVGLQYDEKTETVSYSLSSLEDAFSYNKGEADYLAAREEYATALAKSIALDKSNPTAEEKAKADRYLDSLFLIHDMIAADRDRLDYEAAVNRSAWVSNVEYGGSIDFSTLCAKRRLFTGTFDAIQNALPDTVLNDKDFLNIRKLMLEKDLESPCSMCYVEGSRAKHGVYVDRFLKDYLKTDPEWKPQIADFTSTTRLERTRIEHPEAYAAYQKAMNALSQRKPKEASVRTDYKGEILRDFEGGANVVEKNKNGGVRFNSFSDFEIIHALDAMQVITDMARVGLNGQAYTKVKEFAEAFGNTGMKINLSLVAKDVDADGKLVMDETNGMKYAEALDIRSRYSENVGTVIVVFNDEQLKAALADSTIDFVLPFHRSQWKKSQYTLMGLPTATRDYTNIQNDRYKNPSTGRAKKAPNGNIMPNEYWDFNLSGRENAQKYLDYINENSYIPKFDFLLSRDTNGKWVLPEGAVGDGYFKLLIDFKMYDNEGWGAPQNPVVPEFNMPYIQQMLQDYTGGHQAFPVAHDVVDAFVEGKKRGQFSLSEDGDIAPVADGNYHVYGRDIALEEAIAPVRQDIAPATVSQNATVQDAATYEEPLEEESPYAELDRLTEQAEELERQMYEAMDAGDNEKAMEINADLVDAAVRLTELEQQLDADAQERIASMEDADAPIVGEAPYSESTDTVTLPKKLVQDIARDARKSLGFPAKQVQTMRTLVEKFSHGEIDSEQLHDEIAQRFHTITETEKNADVVEVKKELRDTPIRVSDDIKSSFADYTASVVRPNFGKIRFSNNPGVGGVDMVYEELSDKHPGFFPKTIIQPADQLQQIIEVANMDTTMENSYEIDEATLESVTDNIIRSVNEYRREQRLKMSEQDAFAAFNSLMRDADRYAPALEEDIAPVRADVAPAAPVAEPVQESAPAAEQPIKTVKERLAAKLHNLQTELKRNQQLREESNAEYEQEIARLQTDYYERRNKNTKAANNLLRRMERLRRIQSDVDADYAKRVNELAEQVAKVSEEVRTGESAEAQGAMRRELHQRIVENIRAKFMERGYDLETVLKNAKDLSTFATVDNTPQRVMEKALGYKEGQILADLTVNQVAANETKGIRWLNSYTDRKSGLLAQISKQYSIKPGSKESAAAQMYAEGFYVNGKDEIVAYGDSELAQDFPDAKVQANIKGLARDPRIRQIYDATLAMINESRARNAYPEIQKLDNYFLHFRAMDDTFSRLGIPFNPNDIRAKDLPTDLNGVTADLKPGQPYFASAMHRKGKRTSFDLLGGLERYLTSAKGQIYHIDDIQTLRALRNHIADTYGQAHGLEGLDAMTEEEAAAQIEQVYDAHLSTFAKFLNEEANVIAGKTALIDRGLEGIIGRRGMTFFDTLNRQVGANMVGFNVSSSLTNFIAPVQAFAKTNKAAFVKGFAQTVANRVGAIAGKTDGFAENNPTMIRRQGADRFYRTPWQKASDLGYALMGAVDSISTEIIVRAKYNELVSKGMSAEQAVIEADKWTSRLMGDRSLGQQPQLYNSKMLGLITKFQLEVRNQLDSQFYDTIQEAKVSAEDIQNKQARNAKIAAQVTSTFVTLAVTQHLFGKAFEAVAGYNPAFDIIEAIIKAFGWDDEEESEDTVLDNLGQGFMNLLEDMPYSSVATGGRIPISSALPVAQFIKGKDQYGNEKSRLETVAETAPYWLLPGGYGQIKKTTQGLGMFDEDLPIAGSYTDSGNLRFPVEDTLASRVQAAVFGQYASSNARDYFDNERQSLKKNQIQELVDVDIPIREYWAYRDGLKEQETLAEKFDYIAGLDLPIDKKNILINNVVDRQEAVDLTDYADYANYEEFDFAVKNPEKYDFLQSVGVSVAEYSSFDDDTKDAYEWAYQNPEKYTLSRAVTDDVAVYRQYAKALNDISADKDESGKSISGSRKTKVINYLNNLDADYYTKIMLFKMEYNADDTYNREIIEYLNGRSDISYEEEVTILQELGFTVTADGTVRW